MTITLFLIWLTGRLCKIVRAPALVGQIIMGMIIGPNGTNIAPKHDGLMLAGELGLMLLVLEAGLDVDVNMLSKVGWRAVGIAVSGSVMPLAIGAGLATAVGLNWKAALVVGTVLAPTSVGIALNVLSSAQVLKTQTGQLVIGAAILDDVIALILLSELMALGNPSPWAFIRPILVSCTLLVVIGIFAVKGMPPIMHRIYPLVGEQHREFFVLGLIFMTAIAMAPAVHFAGGSHLLGCFLAGLCFCTDHHAHHAWVRQVKRVMAWLLTIFFSCAIGFKIPPVAMLFKPQIVANAAIFFVAILGKVFTGVWSSPLTINNFFVVGFAMSAWGEFAFVVASASRSENIIDEAVFSSCILCVLLSVIFGPLLLSIAVHYQMREHRRIKAEQISVNESIFKDVLFPVYYISTIKCSGQPGQHSRLLKEMKFMGCEIVDLRIYHTSENGGALAYHDGDTHDDTAQNVVVEAIFSDSECSLPLTPTLEQHKGRWKERFDEIMGGMCHALQDPSSHIHLERWVPGMIDGQMISDSEWVDGSLHYSVERLHDIAKTKYCPKRTSIDLDTSQHSDVDMLCNGNNAPCVSVDGDTVPSQHDVPACQANFVPSERTIFAHADLELRRRFAERDGRDHGKFTGHGFHLIHGRTQSSAIHTISRDSLEYRVKDTPLDSIHFTPLERTPSCYQPRFTPRFKDHQLQTAQDLPVHFV
jgi:Kef-type K+ transport system membrane component KefB